MVSPEVFSFIEISEVELDTRVQLMLRSYPDFERDGKILPLWDQVVRYKYVRSSDLAHTNVVLHDVIVAKNSRMLPLHAMQSKISETLEEDTWYYYSLVSHKGVRNETRAVAASLCRGIVQLENSGLVEVNFINEQFL